MIKAKPAPIRVAERTSLRGMVTMLDNGQPLTDEIRLAIAAVVAAAARSARRELLRGLGRGAPER